LFLVFKRYNIITKNLVIDVYHSMSKVNFYNSKYRIIRGKFNTVLHRNAYKITKFGQNRNLFL